MTSEWWWYAARAAGVLAWALSTMSVVWGLLLASPSLRRRATEASVADLHRFLGTLATVFLGVHLVAVVGDGRDGLGAVDLLVPFAAPRDRLALAAGWLAALALVAVEATSVWRARLAERWWRRAHHAGFAVFVLATVHGLGTGHDAEHALIWWAGAVVAAAVAGLVVARVYLNGSPMRVATEAAAPVAEPAALEVRPVDAVDGRDEPAPVRADRPAPELLERTLEGLRNLDDAHPADPQRDDVFAVPPPAPGAPAPRPLTASQSVSGALVPGAAAPAPPVPVVAEPAPAPVVAEPAPAPAVARPPADAPSGGGVPLPVRSPRRLARTTTAAGTLDGWQPTRASATTPTAPPAPPTEVDPVTGEPDPQAYRKWLRDWLAYVESQA